MLRQELDIGYRRWIHRPAEDLGVYDNASDYAECKRRVHCNCTHGSIAPEPVYREGKRVYELDRSHIRQKMEEFNSPSTGRRHTILCISDHNNVYFPHFARYKTTLPQCLMQDLNGDFIELHDRLIAGNEGIPMPAVDDPTILSLYCEALREQAELLRDNQYVAAYMLGFEELYPEYFHLGHGDFRPASWRHFSAWCKAVGIRDVPKKEQAGADEVSPEWIKWYRFREQAMADRCRCYYRAVLNADENHLAYYPTHGSTFSDTRRAQLGQQASSLACSCDGIEMGHILIGDDKERRNVIMISHNTSFGAPVIVPRLGNKQADLSAIGGGKSFTKNTLRRFLYECVGLGIDKIFPIHWSSTLHDGEWFIRDTEAEPECRKVFDELTDASPYLCGMGRLQPQVGILASDAVWIEGWNPRWTGLMQDALCSQCSMTIVADAIVGKHLARKMPVLILPDDYRLSRRTLRSLTEYAEAGGKIVLWGRFGEQDEDMVPFPHEEMEHFLCHPHVVRESAPAENEKRTLHELFLAGPEYGAAGPRFEYSPVPFHAVVQTIRRIAPECVVNPAVLYSTGDLRDVNVYTLTDRSSLLYVLVNNAAAPASFHLEPDKRLLKDYMFFDVSDKKPVGEEIALGANATKMIWAYHPVTERETDTKVLRAEKAFEGWIHLGANTSALRLLYSVIQTGSHTARRNALAETLLHSLAIQTDCVVLEDGFQVNCRVFDAEGESVSGAEVTFRITPGTFEQFPCIERDGKYFCEIATSRLPAYYDANLENYVPYRGRIRLIISVEKGEYQGGCVENVVL